MLNEFQIKKDYGKLVEAKELTSDPCYDHYLDLLEKQKKAGDLANTILTVGEEVAKSLWLDNWKEKVNGLVRELDKWKKAAKV